MVDLENQLTAALAEIDRLDVAGIHTCHSECQKSNCVLRRELTAVTEQRDRLAEVIEAATVLIAAKGRHNTMLAYDGLRDALQSLTPNTEL
jgi:hypothetical protein